MRIIHLYDEASMVAHGWGSVVSVILNLSKQMLKMGHDITIIERKWINTSSEEVLNGIKFKRFKLQIGSNRPGEDIPYKMINSPIGLTKMILDRIEFALKLKKYLRNEKFDVLHAHVPFTINILAKLDKGLRNRIVYTLHAGEERKRLGLDKNAPIALKLFSPDLHIMKRAKICTVLNHPLKQKLIKKGIEEEKIKVIPNGINVNEFGNFDEGDLMKIRKKYGIPTDRVLIMFSGTITPRKGVEYLLKAMNILIESGYKDIFLVLTGSINIDKKYFEKVYNFAKKKLNNYVKFTGNISYEDLKVLYSACDIFVLPSFEEGDPIALKEALASGKPLVGSNVGGILMQIRNGWNGFLIEPGNSQQLAEKLKYLIENEEKRKRMGRNSRVLAEEEFDWEKVAKMYLKVYEEIGVG